MADKNVTKNRNALTLKTKAKIIRMCNEGTCQAEVARQLGLKRSTVNTVVKNKDKILFEVKNATPINSTIIRKEYGLIADMEKLLVIWIENLIKQHVPLSQAIIQSKAQSLFDDLKAKKGANEDKFCASRGWFHRFKNRFNLHNIKVTGEAAAADVEAAKKYPAKLEKIVKNGGYTEYQIFNVDETGLFWKRMPARTFISKEEKNMPGYKVAKERITLLLGGNAAGTFKLKPMLVHRYENPRALKNYSKDKLPVYYKSNPKAWVTANIFEEWFNNYFMAEVKEYCRRANIPYKILLIIDNAPGHPQNLGNDNIRVEFLPPNTTSLLQPMDQCVIASFKLNYLKKTFSKIIARIDSEEGSGREVLKKVWAEFNILDCIKSIRDTWNDIPVSTMKNAWNKLFPQVAEDREDKDNNAEIISNIVDMAQNLQLEVDSNDIIELVASYDEPLNNEDLLELNEQIEPENSVCNVAETSTQSEKLTSKILSDAFQCFQNGMALFEKYDPDFERSSKVNKNIMDAYSCYSELYMEMKKHRTQSSLKDFFPAKTISPSTKSIEDRNLASTSGSRKTISISSSTSPDSPAKKRLAVDYTICEDDTLSSASSSN